MRAIFNGKRLSSFWLAPPNVNLVDTRSLIAHMRAFSRRCPRFHVVMGDFRHLFHQIAVHPELRCHFGLAYSDSAGNSQCYLWRTLPMGWSYSPFIAQSYAWSVIAHRNPNQESLFVEEALRGAQLPTLLPSRQGGFATVYYDNFLLVTPSETEANEFAKRMHQTCKTFSVIVKPGSFRELNPDQVRREGFEYLGVHFGVDDYGLTWHCGKSKSWFHQDPVLPACPSPRRAAQYAGRILFALNCGARPLCGCKRGRSAIRLLSAIGRTAASVGWDGPLDLSRADRLTLEALWSYAITRHLDPERDWMYPSSAVGTPDFVIATDASSSGLGYELFRWRDDRLEQVLDSTGRPLVWLSEGFHPDDVRHIYLKEMEAATRGLEATFASFPEARNVILVTDNTAVAWGLRYGFTSNAVGRRMLERVSHLLPRARVIQVVSADNVTDCHSRLMINAAEYADRFVRMQTAIRCALAGWRCGLPVPGPHADTGLRHAPPLDEAFELWDDLMP